MISGLGPPGDSAAVTTRVSDNFESLVAGAPSWSNRVNASAVLQIYRFRPAALALQIRCPLLVVLSYRDHVAPADAAMRAAQGLPYIELAMFPAQHFELYSGEMFDRAVATEISFFMHHFACHADSKHRGRVIPPSSRTAGVRASSARRRPGAGHPGRSSGSRDRVAMCARPRRARASRAPERPGCLRDLLAQALLERIAENRRAFIWAASGEKRSKSV